MDENTISTGQQGSDSSQQSTQTSVQPIERPAREFIHRDTSSSSGLNKGGQGDHKLDTK